MEAEAGEQIVNCAPCQGPPSTRRCVLWDLATPLMAEVLYCYYIKKPLTNFLALMLVYLTYIIFSV